MCGESGRGGDDGGVLGHPAVGVAERSVGLGDLVRSQDGRCPSSKQLGSVRSLPLGEPIESFDEVVVELHQHLPSRHDHMVTHMAIVTGNVRVAYVHV